MMKLSFSVVLLLASSTVDVPVASAQTAGDKVSDCHVCGEGGDDAMKENAPEDCPVPSNIALFGVEGEIIDMDSDRCKTLTRNWAARCCTGGWASRPLNVPAMGTYPSCDLCFDKSFPSIRGEWINLLYMGLGTCEEYWIAGRLGQIREDLCDPVEYFS